MGALGRSLKTLTMTGNPNPKARPRVQTLNPKPETALKQPFESRGVDSQPMADEIANKVNTNEIYADRVSGFGFRV